MIYLVAYLVGFIITLFYLIKYERQLDEDYELYLIVSALWIIVIPLKIGFNLYYLIRDKIKEYKTRPPYVDPWEQALEEWDSQDEVRLENQVKSRKKSKQFKFGR